MRILSLLLNQSGSTYYRQYVPMRAMLDAGCAITIVDEPRTPAQTLRSHDVVQISRVAGLDTARAIEHIQKVQSLGVGVVVDYDDDLLNIPPHNPAHLGVERGEVVRAVQAADAITVTSTALAAVYRPYAKRIGIIPNYIDVARWPQKTPTLPSPWQEEDQGGGPLTIGLVGSPSHHEDWKIVAEPMRRILARYDVRFLVAGYLPDYLADLATEYVGWQDISAYQETVNRIDIGLCPLLRDAFNTRKTPIKALEYGMAHAAVIASPTLYRETVAARGIIARTEQDWEHAIESLIVDTALRERHARALHTYVTTRCDVRRYAAAIHAVYRTLYHQITGVSRGRDHHHHDRRTGWAGH